MPDAKISREQTSEKCREEPAQPKLSAEFFLDLLDPPSCKTCGVCDGCGRCEH